MVSQKKLFISIKEKADHLHSVYMAVQTLVDRSIQIVTPLIQPQRSYDNRIFSIP